MYAQFIFNFIAVAHKLNVCYCECHAAHQRPLIGIQDNKYSHSYKFQVC